MVLHRVGSAETLPIAPGLSVSVPIGIWLVGEVPRRLRRGELLRFDQPGTLPSGCLYVPGGTIVAAGEKLHMEGAVLAREPVEPAELAQFKRLHDATSADSNPMAGAQAFIAWKSARDGVTWRLQTVAERRLAGLPYAAPELAQLADGRWCSLPNATHFTRELDSLAVLRLAVGR